MIFVDTDAVAVAGVRFITIVHLKSGLSFFKSTSAYEPTRTTPQCLRSHLSRPFFIPAPSCHLVAPALPRSLVSTRVLLAMRLPVGMSVTRRLRAAGSLLIMRVVRGSMLARVVRGSLLARVIRRSLLARVIRRSLLARVIRRSLLARVVCRSLLLARVVRRSLLLVRVVRRSLLLARVVRRSLLLVRVVRRSLLLVRVVRVCVFLCQLVLPRQQTAE